MSTGGVLTIIAVISFLILMYFFVRQLIKLIAILLTMCIFFAGYLYVKNGNLPQNLQGYIDEGKIAMEQLHQQYKDVLK